MGNYDVSRSFPCPSRALAARYLRWGLQFAPQGGAPLAVLWPGPWSPVDPPGMCRRRRETSQVPGEPLCMRAPLYDPGGPTRPCLGSGEPMLLSGFSTPSAPREPYFRGSITRPTYVLSTLRRAGHPRRHARLASRLLAGPCLDRTCTCWAPISNFKKVVCLSSFPFKPDFPGARKMYG